MNNQLLIDETYRMTRDERKEQIVSVLKNKIGFDMTTLQVARFAGLKKTRYLADLLKEMCEDGMIGCREYQYNVKQTVLAYYALR